MVHAPEPGSTRRLRAHGRDASNGPWHGHTDEDAGLALEARGRDEATVGEPNTSRVHR